MNSEFNSNLAEFKRIIAGKITDQFGDIVASCPRKQPKLEFVIAKAANK